MSLTKKLGVSGALVFSALLLANAIDSRQSLESSPVSDNVKPQLNTLAKDSISTSSMAEVKSAAEVKLLLEQKLPGLKITEIAPSPLSGFYQAFYGGEIIYVSNDGQYIFTGNMLELAEGRPINHTQLAIAEQDAKQAPMRAATIAQIDESDMVVFKAKQEKFVITVFTDVDCAYCRKLHKEMPLLNEGGITVRYMAYPRAGIGSDAYKKLVSVWCADDKLAAMDDAKLRRQFGNFGKMSCKNPIANHYNMTRQLNLSGTPTLVLPDGEMIGGYLPANDLIAHLTQKKASEIEATPGQ